MIQKIIYFLFSLVIIFFGILEFGNLLNGADKDKVVAVGYFSALAYTLIFGFILQKQGQKFLSRFNNQKFIFTVLGSIGAIFIETAIWVAQTFLKTTGVAIHPNLLVDLVMTVPFYTLLSYFVAKWVMKYAFSWPTIALAAGIYETAADGVIGNLIRLNFFGALISPILIPVFMVLYAPIILVPFLLMPRMGSPVKPSFREYKVLLKPLIALAVFPFSLGLGILLGNILK